ncbi:MAG: peptidylprolyl isomerase [FCB group bacterium]|nr:peptidylprolyl isomerase [FCB group bacterium]
MKIFLIVLLTGLMFSCCSKPEEVGVISTKYGDIVVEFYDDVAPMHVENFKILAREGYFDGTTFHRVIPNFVIQGGDPNSKDEDRQNDGQGGRAGKYFGLGDPDNPDTWTVPAEFNDRPHDRGALSMARTNQINSATSQFFICVNDVPQLDHKYSVFGHVIQGMEVVDRIVNLPRDRNDNPREKVEMTVRIVPKNQVIK